MKRCPTRMGSCRLPPAYLALASGAKPGVGGSVPEVARHLDMHPADLVTGLDTVLHRPCLRARPEPADTNDAEDVDALTVPTALATATARLTIDQLADVLDWTLERRRRRSRSGDHRPAAGRSGRAAPRRREHLHRHAPARPALQRRTRPHTRGRPLEPASRGSPGWEGGPGNTSSQLRSLTQVHRTQRHPNLHHERPEHDRERSCRGERLVRNSPTESLNGGRAAFDRSQVTTWSGPPARITS